MKKAEMEEHRDRYYIYLRLSVDEINNGEYKKALECAELSWQYLDGMLQYEKKYEGAGPFYFNTIHTVLIYAPFFFEIEKLINLENLLNECKRIEKNSEEDLRELLSSSFRLTLNLRKLWNLFEIYDVVTINKICDKLSGTPEEWSFVLEKWNKSNVIRSIHQNDDTYYSIYTQLEKSTEGKCTKCGFSLNLEKHLFLSKIECESCNHKDFFHLLYKYF